MLEFFTAVQTLLRILPELLKTVVRIVDLLERFLAWSQKNKINEWLGEVEHAVENLERADSREKKRDAARSIFDVVSKL